MSYNFKNWAAPYFEILIDLFRRDTWSNLDSCDVLLVRHDYDCGYTFNGQAYAQIIDSFGDLCEKRGLSVASVATPQSRLIGAKAHYSPVVYNHSFSLFTISGVFVGLVKGSDFKKKWTDGQLANLWCRILEKANPRIIIGIQPPGPLCAAGKMKRIEVYDLQHGVMSDGDLYYGEKYRKESPSENIPDGFLLWDDQSCKILSKWVNKSIKRIKIGNPWFMRFIKPCREDLLVNDICAKRPIIEDRRPCIIVSLQWGLDLLYCDQVPNGVIIDELEDVIISTGELYNWIIRLHPVQMRDGPEKEKAIRYLNSIFGAEKTQKWFGMSELPLPIVLSRADLHITFNSSIVIEAGWFGIRSGLLSTQLKNGERYHDQFTHERSIGMAEVLPHDAQAIKRWIKDTLARGRGPSTLAFIDEIARKKL